MTLVPLLSRPKSLLKYTVAMECRSLSVTKLQKNSELINHKSKIQFDRSKYDVDAQVKLCKNGITQARVRLASLTIELDAIEVLS